MLPVVASYNCQLLLKISSIGASVKLDLVHLIIQVMEAINENLSRITSQVKEHLYICCAQTRHDFFGGSRFRWCALSYFSLIFLMGHNPSHKSQLSRAINWAEGGLVENACSSKAMF